MTVLPILLTSHLAVVLVGFVLGANYMRWRRRRRTQRARRRWVS